MISSEQPDNRKKIGITMGDPAGVGPELCLKFLKIWTQGNHFREAPFQPVLIGDSSVLEKYLSSSAGVPFRPLKQNLLIIQRDESWPLLHPGPIFIDSQSISAADIQPGIITPQQGQAAYDYVITGIDLALTRQIDALVTNPIHKLALHQAGINYPGHTEILTERTGAAEVVMMLTAPEITCSLVTAHVGLHEVPRLITTERVLQTIRLTHAAMQKIRQHEPTLIICGLNPHAGEQGLFGQHEEEEQILPAIEAAREQGWKILGPLPPDTAFLPKYRKITDAYVCMYHDQGLIPLKALAFEEGVNVTLGLPIVRTSVDHGTAFDIAWKNQADVSSLIAAVDLALRLAE